MNRKKREQLILDSAIRVFAAKGYARTSVSEIISEAQVARGTFYLYFKSKKDLFSMLLDRLLTDLNRSVATMTVNGGNPEADPMERFRASASDFIATLTRHRLLAKIILFDSNGLDNEFNAKMQFFYDQLAGVISHHLDANIRAGLFRTCQTDVAARCIIGSVREIVANWILHDRIELEPTIQSLIDYLINGLSPIAVSLEKGDPAQKTRSQHFGNLH